MYRWNAKCRDRDALDAMISAAPNEISRTKNHAVHYSAQRLLQQFFDHLNILMARAARKIDRA